MEIKIETKGLELTTSQRDRINHQLNELAVRLETRANPVATIELIAFPERRTVEVDCRVHLEPLGAHLVSHREADTVEHAVRLALEDIDRELETKLASQRGDATFGVPSRRLPSALRPGKPDVVRPGPRQTTEE